MKAINLHLEDFGPWMKLITPPISPARRILAINNNNHKRVTSSVLSLKRNEIDYIKVPHEETFVKNLQDHTINQLPSIDLINRFAMKKKIRRNENKDLTFDDLKTTDNADYQSQHINHQYFPYRNSGNLDIIKSMKPGIPREVFTYKLKKSKPHSCTPNITKHYVFWNQRKLVSSKQQNRNFRSTFASYIH